MILLVECNVDRLIHLFCPLLDNNSLTGQIPRSLFKQPKLRVLSLGKNLVFQRIIWFLFLYSNIFIEFIIKANNSLGGTLPTEIGLAKELKVLDIRKCMN